MSSESIDNVKHSILILRKQAENALVDASDSARREIEKVKNEAIKNLEQSCNSENPISYVREVHQNAVSNVETIYETALFAINSLSIETREKIQYYALAFSTYLGLSKYVQDHIDKTLRYLGELAVNLIKALEEYIKKIKKELNLLSSMANKVHQKSKKKLSKVVDSYSSIKKN